MASSAPFKRIAYNDALEQFGTDKPDYRIDLRIQDITKLVAGSEFAPFAEGNTVSHLTYIGDATVGKYCNFGCGTVTCNYDGEGKFHTTIGDYAFIGCNTNLVAPVTVGDHAFTAAGSTIGRDVPAGALGIERAKQTEIDGWGERKLQKYIAKKQKLEADKKNG